MYTKAYNQINNLISSLSIFSFARNKLCANVNRILLLSPLLVMKNLKIFNDPTKIILPNVERTMSQPNTFNAICSITFSCVTFNIILKMPSVTFF